MQKSNEEWQRVLHIVAGVSLAGGLFFALFARGDVQSWAREDAYDVTITASDVAAYRRRDVTQSGSFKEQHGEPCIVLSVRRLHSLP